VPASVSLHRMAIVAIALLLLWRIVQVNAVLYEDTGRPRLGMMTRAQAASSARDKSQETTAMQRILRQNPGEVAALLMLARQLQAEGDSAAASRALRAALELAPLESGTLSLAADHFLRQGDPAAIEMLARLAEHYPGLRERVFPVLVEAIASGRHRPALDAILRRDPSWLGSFIADSCARGVDLAVVMPALLRRSASGKAAPNEVACAVERLRSSGRWDQAYQLWLNTLPRERLAEVGFVFNGGFDFLPLAGGFDWILQARPEREAGHAAQLVQAPGAAGRRMLRVTYNGRRQSGVPAQQYLALAPGRYELSGLGRPEAIKAARGIHWTLRCVEAGRPQAVFASSERFLGSSEWRRFSVEVRVAGSCPGQLLQLEPVGDDGAVAFVSGAAWFDELRLRRL
jgi:hypothetical protein